MLWAFIVWLGALCIYGSAFDILIYAPRMMQSHVYFTARIANVLAARGHKVTVIDNVFRYDVDNELSSDIHEIISVEPSPEVTKLLNTGSLPTILWNSKASPEEQRTIMEGLGHVHRLQCTHLIENSTLIPKLQEIKFDFAIHEVFDSCGVGILEVIGVQKTVIVSSTGPMDVVPITLGISDTLNTPSLLSDYGSYLSFFEKRRNLKFLSGMLNFHEMQDSMISPLFKKYYGLKKPTGEIMRQANLLFYNIHEGSDGMRMRGRRSFDIGGIAFKDQKNLTMEYQTLLSDPRPKVLVSFGTAATSSHMPQNLKNSLMTAMKQMNNVLFIWKYEMEDNFTKQEELTTNIIFKKFLPQTDLLASSKIDLFVTHCGQNSLLEAFNSGVRVLAVPLFGDQHRNAKLAFENGLIEILPKSDIETPAKIVKAVKTGLEPNAKLDQNIVLISSLLRNSKENAENLLISTIEATYSTEFPPNFSKFPKNYHPNTLVRLIDSSIALVFMLFIFVFVNHFRKNYVGFKYPLSFSTK
ncbi:Putative UDP-glucuronosyltransferase ugt-56 [Caenorhabditis elegans]|uniref:Putative UDP-glucuronosyltransferase ugt-56 n=1 Tax=Caenorhabditis elegans TaxID=6239 RepID=UGT56_CAEEL|nr:Putative UDP-glucuronosyltransferase ugt-56 [Caenorhabditis elegans]Q22181.2 RecName: Full=Putative UDP-glucuronosyltransferase ugt-56; Short=UDPGT 56; Flags: Precursor [Caenorhabditis elegans]CAB01585.2 Putative UDP-glucuronosyltransferase ugt-56 [Caenorhabditis elegans]|eukprot:NP_506074.2 Putative UDP-glucuronosyltransferase ugt-56 [Caenorhabditis elegans]